MPWPCHLLDQVLQRWERRGEDYDKTERGGTEWGGGRKEFIWWQWSVLDPIPFIEITASFLSGHTPPKMVAYVQ